jgi:hypothetical protein
MPLAEWLLLRLGLLLMLLRLLLLLPWLKVTSVCGWQIYDN